MIIRGHRGGGRSHEPAVHAQGRHRTAGRLVPGRCPKSNAALLSAPSGSRRARWARRARWGPSRRFVTLCNITKCHKAQASLVGDISFKDARKRGGVVTLQFAPAQTVARLRKRESESRKQTFHGGQAVGRGKGGSLEFYPGKFPDWE